MSPRTASVSESDVADFHPNGLGWIDGMNMVVVNQPKHAVGAGLLEKHSNAMRQSNGRDASRFEIAAHFLSALRDQFFRNQAAWADISGKNGLCPFQGPRPRSNDNRLAVGDLKQKVGFTLLESEFPAQSGSAGGGRTGMGCLTDLGETRSGRPL